MLWSLVCSMIWGEGWLLISLILAELQVKLSFHHLWKAQTWRRLLHLRWVSGHEPMWIKLRLWCVTPLPTMLQLYRGGQFYWLRKPENKEKATDLPQVIDKLYLIMMHRVHLVWAGFELTTIVVINTDCIGSYKSNYHTITTTTASYVSSVRLVVSSHRTTLTTGHQ